MPPEGRAVSAVTENPETVEAYDAALWALKRADGGDEQAKARLAEYGKTSEAERALAERCEGREMSRDEKRLGERYTKQLAEQDEAILAAFRAAAVPTSAKADTLTGLAAITNGDEQ
jgi:Arc/MetJ family transcription regulator